MSQEKEWGDGVILIVASVIYRMRIVVYCDNDNDIFKKPMHLSHNSVLDSSLPTMQLGFVDGNHYVSLIPMPSSSTSSQVENLIADIPNNDVPIIPDADVDVEPIHADCTSVLLCTGGSDDEIAQSSGKLVGSPTRYQPCASTIPPQEVYGRKFYFQQKW